MVETWLPNSVVSLHISVKVGERVNKAAKNKRIIPLDLLWRYLYDADPYLSYRLRTIHQAVLPLKICVNCSPLSFGPLARSILFSPHSRLSTQSPYTPFTYSCLEIWKRLQAVLLVDDHWQPVVEWLLPS